MWLPKDERETLRKYHSYIHNIDESKLFTDLSERVCNATRNLTERGLIFEFKEGIEGKIEYTKQIFLGESVSLNGFLSSSEEDVVEKNAVLKFTLNGLDLADKYNNCWLRIKLWSEEYIKNHPILLIVSFIAGIISTLLVNWLSSFFGAK